MDSHQARPLEEELIVQRRLKSVLDKTLVRVSAPRHEQRREQHRGGEPGEPSSPLGRHAATSR